METLDIDQFTKVYFDYYREYINKVRCMLQPNNVGLENCKKLKC